MRGIPNPDTISVHVAVCPVSMNGNLSRFNNTNTSLVGTGCVIDDIPSIDEEIDNPSTVRITTCVILFRDDIRPELAPNTCSIGVIGGSAPPHRDVPAPIEDPDPVVGIATGIALEDRPFKDVIEGDAVIGIPGCLVLLTRDMGRAAYADTISLGTAGNPVLAEGDGIGCIEPDTTIPDVRDRIVPDGDSIGVDDDHSGLVIGDRVPGNVAVRYILE